MLGSRAAIDPAGSTLEGSSATSGDCEPEPNAEDASARRCGCSSTRTRSPIHCRRSSAPSSRWQCGRRWTSSTRRHERWFARDTSTVTEPKIWRVSATGPPTRCDGNSGTRYGNSPCNRTKSYSICSRRWKIDSTRWEMVGPEDSWSTCDPRRRKRWSTRSSSSQHHRAASVSAPAERSSHHRSPAAPFPRSRCTSISRPNRGVAPVCQLWGRCSKLTNSSAGVAPVCQLSATSPKLTNSGAGFAEETSRTSGWGNSVGTFGSTNQRYVGFAL